jgi:hypothetical protein
MFSPEKANKNKTFLFWDEFENQNIFSVTGSGKASITKIFGKIISYYSVRKKTTQIMVNEIVSRVKCFSGYIQNF